MREKGKGALSSNDDRQKGRQIPVIITRILLDKACINNYWASQNLAWKAKIWYRIQDTGYRIQGLSKYTDLQFPQVSGESSMVSYWRRWAICFSTNALCFLVSSTIIARAATQASALGKPSVHLPSEAWLVLLRGCTPVLLMLNLGSNSLIWRCNQVGWSSSIFGCQRIVFVSDHIDKQKMCG